MMVTRGDLVREALSWERTPHLHGQSVKGRACDCKGFIWGVGRELGLPEAMLPIVSHNRYSRAFSGREMLDGLEAALIRVASPLPGDVIALRLGEHEELPRHLAMLISDRRLIHCYGKGPACVITAPIGRSRPVHSYWTWPSLGAPRDD